MNKNNVIILIYLLVVSILELILTFLIKYDLNSIPLRELNLFYIGNILPIIIEVIFIFLILAQFFNKNLIKAFHKAALFLIITVLFGLMLASYVSVKFNIDFPDEYIFSYPSKKVAVGMALLIGTFIRLFLMALLLNLFFNNGFVVYLKSLITTIFIGFIAFASIFIYTTKVSYPSDNLKPSGNTIGVVLGAAVWDDIPSPLFQGRIKKAAELLKMKRISKIQLTGSNAPGEISEAKAAYNYALSLGVKKHLISIEENTTTTTEQIKFIKKEISDKGKFASILIISDQFHLTRVLEICKFFNVKAVGVASNYKLNWEKLLYYRLRESVALLLFWLFAI